MSNSQTYKKNWTGYIALAIVLFFTLFLVFSGSSFFRMIGWGFALVVVFRMIEISKVKWTLTNDSLAITSGFLPWRMHYFEIPIFQIYESYNTQGMLGHFLDYGTITVRRNDGLNTKFRETHIHNARELSRRINALVHNYQAQGHP